MARKHRKFTDQFKREAIELATRLGSGSEAAKQLGVHHTQIYQWKKKLGEVSNHEAGSADPNAELLRLRKENAQLKKVNEILKAAAAFFSQDHLK